MADHSMALARLAVDLGALRANYRLLAAAAGRAGASRTGAVVKADGYGLGAGPVAHALAREGCADFFVATVDEGLRLTGEIDDVRIYVFSGPVDADDAAHMAASRLIPVLNDVAQVSRWRRHQGMPAAIHVDTGMRRLGFDPGGLDPTLFDGLNVVLLLSHLANADVPEDPMTAHQIALFARVKGLLPGTATSLANSAGTLAGVPSDLADLARPGIALYGGNPFASGDSPMRTVATLDARVVALRSVPAGQPVGYGGTFATVRDTCIAVLGVGYADGVPRALSNRAEVAYQGHRLPVVGRVSMDLTHVDATAVQGRIEVGDWVEVFGRTVRIDETAAAASTVAYEILTRIGTRVERRYIRD